MENKNPKKHLTLCLIHQPPKLLLGMKKRGLGMGKWNGFGGKVQVNETVEKAAKRELWEEAGIEVESMEKVGLIEFEFPNNPEIWQVHVFKANKFRGEPTESEEMRPKWFNVDEIPFTEMWPDDAYWMPLFLNEKKFRGKFLFGEGDVMLDKELREVEEI